MSTTNTLHFGEMGTMGICHLRLSFIGKVWDPEMVSRILTSLGGLVQIRDMPSKRYVSDRACNGDAGTKAPVEDGL
jgi:hypothetical protein